MSEIILAYITCKDKKQALVIGEHLLQKKLCACINIFPQMTSAYFWPPNSKKLERSTETVLIAKTNTSKYQKLEYEVVKIHSYDTPCVIGIPTYQVSKKYKQWLLEELS